MEINDNGCNNSIECGENIEGKINVSGSNNNILLQGATHKSVVRISVFGNDNVIHIGMIYKALNPIIVIGSHVYADRCKVYIGDRFSCEPNCEFLIANTGSNLQIGNDCMFSREIVLRTGESPHLIFNSVTEEYLDQSDGVSIGNHVWVGERAYITKKAEISDNSIVAACAVVTKKFSACNVAIGGNPARIIKEGIRWERNHGVLDRNSAAWKNWHKHK